MFHWKAPNNESCEEWVREIGRHINDSDGVKDNISAQGLNEPWRHNLISERQFKEEADTGDILLFRGTAVGAKITRTATAGEFDHVAMVLKFDADMDDVYMIEATGGMGVALNKWNNLKEHVGPGCFYTKLVWRRVKFDRSDEMAEKLELLLKEALGRSYKCGVKQLTRQVTIKAEDNTYID